MYGVGGRTDALAVDGGRWSSGEGGGKALEERGQVGILSSGMDDLFGHSI